MLGRVHARLGQHEMSVMAFDASLKLARTGPYLWQEFCTVKGRALVGREAGGAGGHWDEEEGRRRLAEVADRMNGGAGLSGF